MVYKITFDNSFTICILKYRLTKNLGSLQCRSCGKCNFYSIKVFNDGAIFTLIICLIAIKQLIFSHLFIQNVSAMCFIDNNQVVIRNCRHCIFCVVQNTLYHTLNSCNMYTGFFINFLIFKPLDIINLIKRHKVLKLNFFKYILSLFAERCSVNKEQNSAETFCL